jgi:chitin disaccharide deacetylase
MNNNLFIVSDDLGLGLSVNEGIIKALKEGWINGASLMANGEEFQDAAEKLKSLKTPNIGVHFVLVEEKPLVLKKTYKDHKIFFTKYILGQINLNDLEEEMRAQLDKCLKAGINVSFLNSHQHLHLLPGILNIVIRLAKENNIKYIRTTGEPFSLKAGLFRGLESVFLSFLSKLAKNKIKKAGLNTNDIFIGFLRAGNLQKEDVVLAKNISEKNKDKIVELGCHIGFENDVLRKKYKNWGGYNWQREFEIITNRHD